ncbi:MAG: hypothetical protein V1853_02475 [bacterium]
MIRLGAEVCLTTKYEDRRFKWMLLIGLISAILSVLLNKILGHSAASPWRFGALIWIISMVVWYIQWLIMKKRMKPAEPISLRGDDVFPPIDRRLSIR